MTLADEVLAATEARDPLYCLVHRLVRDRLVKSPRILTETETLRLQTRQVFPDSFWSEVESGYRVGLAKVYQGVEIWAWVIVSRQIRGKLMGSEIDTIERAVGAALGTPVEAMVDESGAPQVHFKGLVN